ncbi:MAG TPA: DedA family protein [Pseudonocardia sp.]|nr:DedA family protein [Pseudonocardia sp.]
MSAGLPGVLAPLGPVLDRYGYLAVTALVAVESFGVPAPGQTIIIVAGVYAGTGRMNIALVAGLAFLAAVGGDNVGYAIGRAGGRGLVLRAGRFIGVTDRRLRVAEGFFTRHGGRVVAGARFVDGLRQVNGLVAGLAGMRWWRFLVFNGVGAAVWVALWTGLGFYAGANIDVVYERVRRYELYVFALLALVVAVLVARRLRRRARARLVR